MMVESYKKFWEKIIDFTGVASRKDYWWPVIINYILGGLIIAIIQKMIGHPIADIYNIRDLGVSVTRNVVVFLVWVATLSVKVRRLHDTDHSGWWVLIDLVPLIGTIWFFILMILPSRNNRWGA